MIGIAWTTTSLLPVHRNPLASVAVAPVFVVVTRARNWSLLLNVTVVLASRLGSPPLRVRRAVIVRVPFGKRTVAVVAPLATV